MLILSQVFSPNVFQTNIMGETLPNLSTFSLQLISLERVAHMLQISSLRSMGLKNILLWLNGFAFHPGQLLNKKKVPSSFISPFHQYGVLQMALQKNLYFIQVLLQLAKSRGFLGCSKMMIGRFVDWINRLHSKHFFISVVYLLTHLNGRDSYLASIFRQQLHTHLGIKTTGFYGLNSQ